MLWLIPARAWQLTGRSGRARIVAGCLPIFEPVMTDAVAVVGESGVSLYLCGSVANGTARPGSSDLDLLSIGLQDAAVVGQRLSARYAAAGVWKSPRSRLRTWPATPTRQTAAGCSCATTASTSRARIHPPRSPHFLPMPGLRSVSTAILASIFGDGGRGGVRDGGRGPARCPGRP